MLDEPRKWEFRTGSTPEDRLTTAKGTSLPGCRNEEERKLYPLLAKYLFDELGIYPKTIDEHSSSDRSAEQVQWLHPALVGLQMPSEHLCLDASDYAELFGNLRARSRTWSFEVKVLINAANVREAFFQAVSNSSWANLGYLVAATIEKDVRRELQTLSAAHGIGIILLDKGDLENCRRLIPAKERPSTDWGLADRLAADNPTFHRFLQSLALFIRSGHINPTEWDVDVLPSASVWD